MARSTRAVTVGMPVYNAAAYLERALSSLAAQSFSDFNLLISDNASTDSTPEILQDWAARDPRIEIVRQRENIGAVKNFKYVLENSKSPWFMFAAHDDKWSSNYIEALYKKTLEQPATDLVVPRVVFFYPDGRAEKICPVPLDTFIKAGTARMRGLLRSAHGSWFYGLYRRKNLLAVQSLIKNYTYAWGADLVTLLPFLLSGRVAASDDAVFYHFETILSRQCYRPQTLEQQWGVYCAFWREVMSVMKTAPLTAGQKIALFPTLIRYTDSHSFKLHRILRTLIKHPFQKLHY